MGGLRGNGGWGMGDAVGGGGLKVLFWGGVGEWRGLWGFDFG